MAAVGILEARAEVLADDVVAAEFDDRGARQFDGTHQHRLRSGRPSDSAREPAAACPAGSVMLSIGTNTA